MLTAPNSLCLLAGVAAGFTAWLSLPLWRRFCLAQGAVDAPGRRKIHDVPTPLAGGLAVLTGILLPLALGGLAAALGWKGAEVGRALAQDGSDGSVPWAGILVGAVGMLGLGWVDDLRDLRPAAKLAGQIAVAFVAVWLGVRAQAVAFPLLAWPLTVFWIVAGVNSMNLMDNMNGLCAGLGAIGAACCGLIAAALGQAPLALLAFLIAGAALGFLPHNYPRAGAFLGDSGSHLIGFLLSALAILPRIEHSWHPPYPGALVPVLLLAVPLGDMAWVAGTRWRRGQPISMGDTNHLSHRLERRGLSRPAAVALIWALALVCGGAAFLCLNR